MILGRWSSFLLAWHPVFWKVCGGNPSPVPRGRGCALGGRGSSPISLPSSSSFDRSALLVANHNCNIQTTFKQFLYRRLLCTNIAYFICAGLYIGVADSNRTIEMIDISWVTNSDHGLGVLGRTMISVAVKQFGLLFSGFVMNAALWRWIRCSLVAIIASSSCRESQISDARVYMANLVTNTIYSLFLKPWKYECIALSLSCQRKEIQRKLNKNVVCCQSTEGTEEFKRSFEQ